MDPKRLSRSIPAIPIIILAIGLVACSGASDQIFADQESISWSYRLFSWDSQAETTGGGNLPPGTYAIDPIFSDFYQALGGEQVLGPAISPAKRIESQTTQYTESSLMIFDPLQPASARYQLAPLGITLGVAEGDLLGKTYRDGRIIGGYLVIEEFLIVYEKLGGARFVGRPISEATYNVEKRRVEQYFENLGMYQLDGRSEVQFMPYGAYACDRNCRAQKSIAGIPARQPILPEAFLKKTLELGLPFVGKPLTGLQLAADGKQEVIFENLVLFSDPESPEQVAVRPIAAAINQEARELTVPDGSNLNVFHEINEGLGFNVPLHFISYLEKFGGMQVAGEPISEVFSPEDGIYWQCFTNLCLQFNLNAEGDQRLRPVPLGAEYKTQAFEQVRDFSSSQDIKKVDIRVWEENTYVSSQSPQVLHAAIYEEGKPLKNYEPLLIATMPDGSQRKAYFPPSDEQGSSSIQIAPIPAPSGTLIAYQVCLFGLDGEQTCVGDNYLIWDAE